MSSGSIVTNPLYFHTKCPEGMNSNGYSGVDEDWWGRGSMWSSVPEGSFSDHKTIVADAYDYMERTDTRKNSTAVISYHYRCKTKRRANNAKEWILKELETMPPPPVGWGFRGIVVQGTNVAAEWAVLKKSLSSPSSHRTEEPQP